MSETAHKNIVAPPLNNEDIILFNDLIVLYKAGKVNITDDNWIIYHLNEERKAKGIAYAIFCHGREFERIVKWSDEMIAYQKEQESILIWGKKPKSWFPLPGSPTQDQA